MDSSTPIGNLASDQGYIRTAVVWSSSGPPVLGADNVIRFVDVDHFLRELAGNLGRGRAFVRTRRQFTVQQGVGVRIEVPGVAWGIDAEAVVVFTRDGYVGLEFEDFEAVVLPRLDRLGEEASRNKSEVPEGIGERTIIAPMPIRELVQRDGLDLGQTLQGAAEVEISDDDSERTGSMLVPPELSAAAARRTHRDPAEDEAEGTVELSSNPPPGMRLERTPLEGATMRLKNDRRGTSAQPRLVEPIDRVDTDAGRATADLPRTAPEPVQAERDASQGLPKAGGRLHPGRDPQLPEPQELRAEPEAPRSESVPTADLAIPEAGTIDLRSVQPELIPLPPAPAKAPVALVLPTVETMGVEALEDRALHTARATANGIVRIAEPADLLGWYLAEIRHGSFTLLGGPEARVGETVRLKLALGRVINLEGTVQARVGPWLTLRLESGAQTVAELLAESKDAWCGALEAVGIAAKPAPVEAPPKPEPSRVTLPPPAETVATPPPEHAEPEPVAAPPPEVEEVPAPELPRPSRSVDLKPAAEAPKPEPPRSGEIKPLEERPPIAAVPPARPAEDDGPPRLGRLNGDVVAFGRAKDLKHELETNVKNAGLFVEAAPIPIRTHKSLKVSVGGNLLPVRLELDVVFAAGGRVGFSVTSAAEARRELERALENLAHPKPLEPEPAPPVPAASAPAPGPSATVPAATPAPSVSTADLSPPAPALDPAVLLAPFSGRITRPLNFSELLDLAQRRAETPADLGGASVLVAFDYLAHHNARGVLTLRSTEHKATLYFHEGSIAFLELSPTDEPSTIGRILVVHKKVTEPGLRESLERAKAQRRCVGRLLVALGHIQKKALSDALREQVRMRMEAIFNWKDGNFEWGPWREPPGDADLVLSKGVSVFARHVRQRYETLGQTELETLFGKNMGRAVILREAPDTLVSALNLQQREVRFLEMNLAGDKNLADAITASPAGRLTSLRLVATGLSMGVFAYKDGQRTPLRAPSRVASGEKESTQIVQLRRNLKERLAMYNGQNHFETLGVHWSAHYRSFRAAFDRAKADLNLTRGPLRDAPNDVQDLARDITKILDKAYATLTDERERVAYRKQLFDKTERQYSADMLVKQGEVALMRGDRVSAIEALETAVELDPSTRNRGLLAAAREGRGG